jgi:hypothetical protein
MAAQNSGWVAWRNSISPTGQIAFRQAVAMGQSEAQAMTEFWKAAYKSGEVERPRDKIISCDKDGITVLTGPSNYKTSRKITWTVAVIKAKEHELVVPKDTTPELMRSLYSNMLRLKWSNQFMANLKA